MIEFTSQDIFLIGVLTFLEGILSVDNALVLAILARHLPKEQQKRALTYGLVGAFTFRFIALFLVTHLVEMSWVKFVGGGYLVYLAVKSLFFTSHTKNHEVGDPLKKTSFWKTVVLIELTDIAFAVDSILAAVALTNKLWVIYAGGVLGILIMRFAASKFIVMIEKFPKLEKTAYMLVFIIGMKVIVEGLRLPGVDFHSPAEPAFLIFWSIMAICIAYGFIPKKKGH
jgi:YkoY family integral membrane protein